MLRRFGPVLVALGIACDKGSSGPTPVNGAQPSLAPLACQPGCAARPADGIAALKGGQYDAALDAYHCADTPEAAFGAGISTLLTAIEGPSMTSVLSDFGEPPMKASAVVGSTGWLSRYASRWKGTGTITRSDAAGADLETAKLELGRQTGYSGSSYVTTKMLGPSSLAKLSISFSQSGPLQAGQRLAIGCAVSGASSPSVSYSTADVSCYTSSLDCGAAGGGAVVVTKPGGAAGDPVEYTLDNVLVSCSSTTHDGPATPARLKGTISTFVASEKVNLSGLPELFSADLKPKVAAGVTVEKVLTSASGLAGSFELASCYFNAAGSATGDAKVFDLPTELLGGGAGVPVSGGDAKILAGFSALSASAIVAAEAYRLPIELRGLICSDSAGIPCISDEETATRVNAGVQMLADKTKIAIARRLLMTALTSFSESSDRLGPQSFFVKNATTQSAIERIKAVVDKLLASLGSGPTAMPYVTPELKIDLKALFDSPPDPAKISVDPLSYNPASKRLETVDAFWDQAFPAGTIDWLRSSDKYTFDNGHALVLDPVSLRFETSFPF